MPEENKKKKKELLWWQVLFIIVSSLIVLYLSTLYKWKQLGYAAPILPFFALFIPLITVGHWKWWQASLTLVGLMITTMISITSSASLRQNYMYLIRSMVPIAIISSLSVLISSVVNGKIGLSFLLLLLILPYLVLTALGSGNIIVGGLYSSEWIGILWTFIKDNPVRLGVLLLALAFFVLYFVFSSQQTASWIGGKNSPYASWMPYFNMIWVVLGILMAVWVYSASVSVFTSQDSFWTRLMSIFTGGSVQRILKVLGFIAVCFGLIYGMYSLLSSSTLAGNIVTSIIQIVCVFAILSGILKYIMNHPRLFAAIAGNPFVKLIFNIIFLIPCLFVYLIGGVKNTNIKILPESNQVYAILFGELLLVGAYILLPMFRKWLYTFTPTQSNGDFPLEHRISGTESAIELAQKKLDKTKAMGQATPFGSGIDWEMVYSKQLYLKKNTPALTSYLKSLGYKETYGIRDSFIIKAVLGKPLTLSAAISYIQTKGRVEKIMTDSDDLKNMKNKLAALGKQEKDGNGPFESKILLNKPTYINSSKYLGLYENLKGGPSAAGVADDYNYNYGLSCWIFLMAQGAEYGVGYSQFTKVLDYGGKPTILFNPEINTLKITVKAYKKDSNTPYDKVVYTTKNLPLQRWNNIVINYVGGTLDIFINNNLVASVNNVLPYMAPDSISIGDNPGISGAVANVTYFSAPITKSRITFFYNSLVNKDPPII